MASKPTVEAPKETTPPVEKPASQSPPAEEPKASPATQEDIAALQSTLQRQIADAQRGEAAAKREAARLNTELGHAQGHIKLLTEQGELGGDEAARLERLSHAEADLTQRREAALGVEKTLSARVLALEYGVPEADLLVYDDPKDMKIAALEWERTHREAAPAAPAGGEPPPRDPPPTTPPSDFDLGDGGVSAKSIKDMSKEEFAEYQQQMRRNYHRTHGYSRS